MSLPFSNTHLRVPRGFGALLEGLVREILRDQPKDIPKYSAQYFDTLLKQRAESGVDPAEWAARLEDRFYNNHAFKTTETAPEKETPAEVSISKEQSFESQTEGESSSSAEGQNFASEQLDASEKYHSTERTHEEDAHDVTEKQNLPVEMELSEGESVNRRPAADTTPDEPSSTDEEKDSTITALDQVDRPVNETDNSPVQDQNIPSSEAEPTDLMSLREMSNVDVCSQEIEAAEDEGDDKKATADVDKDFVNPERDEKNEVAEPDAGFADVDVCASELAGTVRRMEEGYIEVDKQVEEKSLKPQPEGTIEEASLSMSGSTEGIQQVEKDQAEKTKEEERADTESSPRETHKSLAGIEGDFDPNVLPLENSLVEISFEDVPEAQQVTEIAEKESLEVTSTEEALQTEISEMQHKPESKEEIEGAIDQKISKTEDHQNSGGEIMESLHDALDILKEKVDTVDTNLNDSSDDEEEGEGTEDVNLFARTTSEAGQKNQEDKIDEKTGNDEKISESNFNQNEDPVKEAQSNDLDLREDTTENVPAGEKGEILEILKDQEINDSGARNNSPRATQPSASVTAMEAAESEKSEQDLAEQEEECQKTLTELQLGDTEEEKEVTSKEGEEVAGQVIDSEVQEKSDAIPAEENISLQTATDLQGVKRPDGSEEDPSEPAAKEECSRPQEEEDIMDIPLDDPEANRAAAKIQAGFRGHMTRKKMKPEDKAEGEERQEDRGQ